MRQDMLNQAREIYSPLANRSGRIEFNHPAGVGIGSGCINRDFAGVGTCDAKDAGSKRVRKAWCGSHYPRVAPRIAGQRDRPTRCGAAASCPNSGIELQTLRTVRDGAGTVAHWDEPAASGQKSLGVTLPPVAALIFVSVAQAGLRSPLMLRVTVETESPESSAKAVAVWFFRDRYSLSFIPECCHDGKCGARKILP